MVEPNELLFHSMTGDFSSKKEDIKSSILALEESQQLLIKVSNFNKVLNIVLQYSEKKGISNYTLFNLKHDKAENIETFSDLSVDEILEKIENKVTQSIQDFIGGKVVYNIFTQPKQDVSPVLLTRKPMGR